MEALTGMMCCGHFVDLYLRMQMEADSMEKSQAISVGSCQAVTVGTCNRLVTMGRQLRAENTMATGADFMDNVTTNSAIGKELYSHHTKRLTEPGQYETTVAVAGGRRCSCFV